MNGIDYSSLMGNTELFSDVAFKGNVTGTANKKSSAATQKTDDGKQTNTDKDTYEHSTQTQKAGYDRPTTSRVSLTQTQSTESSKYKAIDSDGIQEGVELSDAAKNLLKELREKYGDKLEISAASWSTDDESDYYASLTSKEYSVLINPELLEQMASDESVRKHLVMMPTALQDLVSR
jgi:membrane-bound lytic murein transglycosylase B